MVEGIGLERIAEILRRDDLLPTELLEEAGFAGGGSRYARHWQTPAHLDGIQEGTAWFRGPSLGRGPVPESPVCSTPAQWTRFKACSRTAQRPPCPFFTSWAWRRCWASSAW